MEMEGGRGFSELLRNTSDEMFIKTIMENPIGVAAPSMEMMGFRNISQSFRGDSEELFNAWLMNAEVSGHGSANISHRTRQASKRIATELATIQQNGSPLQKKSVNENLYQQSMSKPEEHFMDSNQQSPRNAAEKGIEASNLYLAKAWFHSSQPMTRSRSSELRRRYVAMQNFQTPTIAESPRITGAQDITENNNANNHYDISMGEVPNQYQTFMSPSNSSTSAFNNHQVAYPDTVSSVVNMLKGSLERKKLGVDKEITDGNSFNFYNPEEIPVNFNVDHDAANPSLEPSRSFQGVYTNTIEQNVEGYFNQVNHIHVGALSREPSQSESSAACDGPANSFSACVNSGKNVGNGSSVHSSKEYRDIILDNNLKDGRKKSNMVRMGSISSGCSADRGDPTKKRRVERSRKMQEAKERSSIPTVPSDMQSVLKRCENLEKEVRSLKLNLSFMNRKDSEQTKQIEELQTKNDQLADEKERLLEEIERIISENGQM